MHLPICISSRRNHRRDAYADRFGQVRPGVDQASETLLKTRIAKQSQLHGRHIYRYQSGVPPTTQGLKPLQFME